MIRAPRGWKLYSAIFTIASTAAMIAGCGGEKAAPPTLSDGAVGEWPQFRGPGGLGVSEAKSLPTEWSAESPNLRFKVEIPGRGNSSPVVSGGRIFLTSAIAPGDGSGQVERSVLALDLATGETLWSTAVYAAPPEKGHPLNTNAAPTPVSDGEHLYVYFGSVLACLDHEGQLLWQTEVDPRYYDYVRYGVASSPVLVGPAVVVVQDKEWAETPDVGWMAAFDRRTGEELWRNEWTHTCCSYSTPLVWHRGGADELVFAHSGAVIGYDPATGDKLWEANYSMLQFVSSLSVVGEELLCTLGGAHNNKGNACYRLTGTGAETQLEQLWYDPRRAPESASPVLYDGKIFAVTEGGVLSVYDPATGENLAKRRLTEGRGYRSSLVAGDGKVYAASNDGVVAVVKAGSKNARVIAYNQIGDGGNNATPAIAGGCLLLRSLEHLYCFEREAGRAKGEDADEAQEEAGAEPGDESGREKEAEP